MPYFDATLSILSIECTLCFVLRNMFILAGGMMGQFQGILGNLQKGKKLPMGRGYAPPGAGGITDSISTVYFVLYINYLYIL